MSGSLEASGVELSRPPPLSCTEERIWRQACKSLDGMGGVLNGCKDLEKSLVVDGHCTESDGCNWEVTSD